MTAGSLLPALYDFKARKHISGTGAGPVCIYWLGNEDTNTDSCL